MSGKKEEIKRTESQKAIDKLLDKKMKSHDNLYRNWKKLYDYMKPFFDGDSDLSEAAKEVNSEIISMPLDDLMMLTLNIADKMSMLSMQKMFDPSKKMMCISCQREFKMGEIMKEEEE